MIGHSVEEIIDELERAAVSCELKAAVCPEPRKSGLERRADRLRAAANLIDGGFPATMIAYGNRP